MPLQITTISPTRSGAAWWTSSSRWFRARGNGLPRFSTTNARLSTRAHRQTTRPTMLDSKALTALLQRDPLLYVDAGARGDLEGDWRNFPKGCLSVLAFEPDQKAVIDWENTEGLRHVERAALWSRETDVNIHIGKVGSTSSVWPPDMDYLARFARRHVEPRATQSTAQVRARPLDAILA